MSSGELEEFIVQAAPCRPDAELVTEPLDLNLLVGSRQDRSGAMSSSRGKYVR